MARGMRELRREDFVDFGGQPLPQRGARRGRGEGGEAVRDDHGGEEDVGGGGERQTAVDLLLILRA